MPVTPRLALPTTSSTEPSTNGSKTDGRVRLGAGVLEPAGLAAAEGHLVGLAAAVHLDVQAGGQGVDHRGADAVQAAGGGVGAAAELAAGVQLGEDHLDAGQPGFRFDVHGDAAAVVVDLHGVVGVQDDLDVVAEAGEGLVDGVVDDFPEAVHEAAGVRGADVHARALADGLEAFQHGEMPGGVIRTWCHGCGNSFRNGMCWAFWRSYQRSRSAALIPGCHSLSRLGHGTRVTET